MLKIHLFYVTTRTLVLPINKNMSSMGNVLCFMSRSMTWKITRYPFQECRNNHFKNKFHFFFILTPAHLRFVDNRQPKKISEQDPLQDAYHIYSATILTLTGLLAVYPYSLNVKSKRMVPTSKCLYYLIDWDAWQVCFVGREVLFT